MAYTKLVDYRFNPITSQKIPQKITEEIVVESTMVTNHSKGKLLTFYLRERPNSNLETGCETVCSIKYKDFPERETTKRKMAEWREAGSGLIDITTNSYSVFLDTGGSDTYAGWVQFLFPSNQAFPVTLLVTYEGLGSVTNKKNHTEVLGDTDPQGNLLNVNIPGFILLKEGSIALGRVSTASGESSMALGSGSTASGISSIALSLQATASGDYAIAVSRDSTASGEGSIALGRGSTASKSFAIALGSYSTASGSYAIALGDSATASDDYVTALGSSATASGKKTTAVGSNSSAKGNYSTTLGAQSRDNGHSNAVVMGYEAEAVGAEAVVAGFDAKSYANGVSLGHLSFAEEGNIAIGSGAEAGQADATRIPGIYADIISIGRGNKALGESSVIITNNFQTSNGSSTVVGIKTNATGGANVALGFRATAAYESVVVGYFASAKTTGTSLGATSKSEQNGVSAGYNAVSGSYGVSIGSNADSESGGISIGGNRKSKQYGINIGGTGIAESNEIRIGGNHSVAYIGTATIKNGKFQVISDARDKANKTPINLDKEFLKKIDFIQFKLNKRSKYIWNIVTIDSEGNPIMRPEKKVLFDSIMTKADIVPRVGTRSIYNLVDPIVPRTEEKENITDEERDFISEYNKLRDFTADTPIGEKWSGKLSKEFVDDDIALINAFYTVEKDVLFSDDYEKATESEEKIRFGVTAQSVIKALPEAYLDHFNNDYMYLVENLCVSSPEKDPRHATNTNHDETVLELKDGASELCVDSEDMFWTVSKIVKDIIIELETYETKEGTNQKLQTITDAFNAFSAGELVINNTPTELGISTGDCGTVVGLASKDNGNAKTSVYGCEAEAKGVFASVYGNKARGYEGTFCAGHEAFAEANNVAIGDGAEAGQEDVTRIVDKYENNIALGTRVKIRNKNSLVVTKDFTSLKQCATVLGMGSVVLQDWGTSVGQASRVNGIYGVGIGKGVMCENGFSTAVGSNAITRGYNSAAYGYAAQAEGLSTTSVGHGSYSLGTGATAVGKSAKAIGVISTALGNGTKANADYSVVIGALEETVNDFDIVIGNSASTYARVGSNVFIDGQLYSVSDARDKDDIKDNEIGLDFINQIKTYSYLKNPRDKYVTRKIIEKKINTDVELVDATVPDVEVEEVFDEVEYKKKSKATKKRQLGISAQQIKKLLGRSSKKLGIIENVNRRLVNDDDDDEKNVGLKSARLAVNYEAFTPILIKAIQDQSKIISDLEGRIKQLEAPLANA